MNINEQLAKELEIKVSQVDATVQLIDEGNTIPFIARYRKEVTGSLNDEVLRNLYERLTYLRNLEDRKNSVLASIEEQGKLTEELKKQILDATTLVVVEDLYRPYKQKRRTRATVAKEKGLEPLADIIASQDADKPIAEYAADFINEEKEVKTAEEAIAGACDIIAERISDEADYRIYIRKLTGEEGLIVSEAKDEKAQSVYENYYKFSEKISTILGHRVLALNRGEDEKFLTVKIEAPVEKIIQYLEMRTIKKDNEYTNDILKGVVADAYDRLIAPAIEREIRSDLTEKAQDSAIKVFGKNLTQLLMQPPIAGHFVLGWDPAFRTGCKLAVVDPTGKVLDTVVIYPTAPQFKVDEAKRILKRLIEKYNITVISVGNGTASRESEQVIVELLHELNKPDLSYIITNEAGASVYSASKLATEEFPNFDVGQRSAASIARRVQDPLAELVKIDPKSIGVGQYQHDMNQKKLGEQLEGVVEDCVNKVGVDVNTASASLLEYVSGISKPIAKNIVAYREENGRFLSRAELLKVPKLGPKAFEQCAGFLRIRGGKNPLDNTSVHPESYEAAKKLLESLGFTPQDIKTLQAEQAKAVKEDEDKRKAEAEKAEKDAKAAARNGKDRRNKNEIQVKNADSAMGKLLAQAFAKAGKNVVTREEANGAKDAAKAGGNTGNTVSGILSTSSDDGAASVKGSAGLSHLSTMIKDKKKLAEELGIGEITLDDIIKELEKPGRDPRKDMPAPILRQDVLEMKDLKEGMVLKGTVRNVIDFGVFVDIGVHQDGLVHISQITNKKFIKHPLDALSVGDVVDVKVMSVDLQKKRIQLTMIM
ncbi:MAG: RNA-binding transcriptional accessory protein [Lachnospiraceae bacterium]|nr:RNA-binding transcriptional accessory protein [Lachnospiraceae bacterium]MBQ6025256.1 RNA-binding transcriptional accessory protein [Lachnospiraceae bacterium]